MKNIEEKSKITSDNPWGAALARAPQDRLCLTDFGAPHLSEHQGHLETPFFPYLFILVSK